MYSWSVIKVKFRGSLRGGYGHDGSWGRWQILFNGSHCSDPGWIESLNYNSESDTSHHKSTGSKPLTVISCSSHPLYTHPAIRLSFLPSPSLYPSSHLSILPTLTLCLHPLFIPQSSCPFLCRTRLDSDGRSENSDQLFITIVILHYRNYGDYSLYRSCPPICEIAVLRLLSLRFIDELEEDANISVPIKIRLYRIPNHLSFLLFPLHVHITLSFSLTNSSLYPYC